VIKHCVEELILRCSVKRAALLLVVLILAAYLPSLRNGFVTLDDYIHVTNNEHVLKGITIDGTIWAFSNKHDGNWIPLTFLSHMFVVEVFGPNPAAHHAVNLVLHCINALLLFFCLLILTNPLETDQSSNVIPVSWRCLAVAALFGLHPIHVESVAWITELKDVLSTLFWLLSICAYVWHSRSPSLKRMSVVSLCMALGLMAKPMLVTLPFVLLLLDYWPLCRTSDAPCSGAPKAPWSILVREKLPLFALTVVASVLTSQTQQNYGAMAPWNEWGLWQRVTTALGGYLGYLIKAFFPVGLAAHYPVRASVPFLEWGAGLILLAGGTYLAYRFRRRAPYAFVGWLWLVGTLVPVIGLAQAGTQAMADRYAYVPFIGLYIIVVWGMSAALERLSSGRKVGAILLSLLCLTLAGLTWRQTQFWHDSVSLYVRMIEVNPDNFMARDWLPDNLMSCDDLDGAEAQLRRVLRKHPDNESLLTGMGLVHARRKEYEEAIPLLEKAIRNDPDSWVAHNTLGASLAALERYEEAGKHFAQALRLKPDSKAVERNLAVVQRRLSVEKTNKKDNEGMALTTPDEK